MRTTFLLLVLLILVNFHDVTGQNPNTNRKIKTITVFKVDNKVKRIDHLTTFNNAGQKTEEVEYFADGTVKNQNHIRIRHTEQMHQINKVQ